MNYWTELIGNKPLVAALAAWALAQTLKVFFVLLFDKKLDFRRFVGSGGMPSSHASFVTALTTAVARVDGLGSVTFAVSLVVTLVVMYDAAGVRRAAGEQAKILNRMMEHWDDNDPKFMENRLKELLGHTPLQVFAGAFLGIAAGLFFTM